VSWQQLCLVEFEMLRSEMNSLIAASCSKSGMKRRSFHRATHLLQTPSYSFGDKIEGLAK
jgi:hypothetical protein